MINVSYKNENSIFTINFNGITVYSKPIVWPETKEQKRALAAKIVDECNEEWEKHNFKLKAKLIDNND